MDAWIVGVVAWIVIVVSATALGTMLGRRARRREEEGLDEAKKTIDALVTALALMNEAKTVLLHCKCGSTMSMSLVGHVDSCPECRSKKPDGKAISLLKKIREMAWKGKNTADEEGGANCWQMHLKFIYQEIDEAFEEGLEPDLTASGVEGESLEEK